MVCVIKCRLYFFFKSANGVLKGGSSVLLGLAPVYKGDSTGSGKATAFYPTEEQVAPGYDDADVPGPEDQDGYDIHGPPSRPFQGNLGGVIIFLKLDAEHLKGLMKAQYTQRLMGFDLY